MAPVSNQDYKPQKTHITQKGKFLLKDEGYAILGAVFEVYRELGCGFLEAVYQESLGREFYLRGIPFVSQSTLSLFYKKQKLQQIYQPDFICFGQIILELKAMTALGGEHRAQLHNYLKATGLSVGYLINFGHYPNAQTERIVRTKPRLLAESPVVETDGRPES
ncbi:MAG: GxxExxY protein [Chloroflexi bacterium]|nr:GxxExxY protein [Chloroflexota bacterium]